MLELKRLLKRPYQKFILSFIIMFLWFILSVKQNSQDMARAAGGLSCFLFAALLILAVCKALYFEIRKDNFQRGKGPKFFAFFHQLIGWLMFVLIGYHSLFFLNLFLCSPHQVAFSLVITGIFALMPLIIVMLSGSNIDIKFRELILKSTYFRHIFATIVLALLIVLHINF